MRRRTMLAGAAGAAATIATIAGGFANIALEPEYTTDFRLEHCRRIIPREGRGNPYFSLKPGRFWRYEGVEEGAFVELEIRVLPHVKVIDFELNGEMIRARTRVIEEREWEDGELVEVSRNFFGRCSHSSDIFYFGENVDIYENGKVISHEGEWLAGRDGALPGLIMPELFLLGARYFQEIAPESDALDRAKHVDMGFTYETSAGVFENCVMVLETTPVEPDEESIKIYAPGVGLIVDDFLELVEYH